MNTGRDNLAVQSLTNAPEVIDSLIALFHESVNHGVCVIEVIHAKAIEAQGSEHVIEV
jgi:hypothetical protein